MIHITAGMLPGDYERYLPEKLLSVNETRKQYLARRKIKSEYAVSVYASAAFFSYAAEYSGKKPDELIFEYDERGKPFFRNIPDFFLSLSHSFPFYAVAFSDSPIGIDIEVIKKAEGGIAKRMFTENELRYACRDDSRFYEIWTKKEAYSKFTGKGIGLRFFRHSPLSARGFFLQR